MNPFEMVAIIVVVGVIGGVLKHVLAPRTTSINDDQPHNADNNFSKQRYAQAQRVNQLEKRLEVLEQIVTSDGYDLKQRFKDLQDKTQETD